MLFKNADLEGIKAGAIGLAFRQWEKPTVKQGSLLKTGIGLVLVNDITEVKMSDITEADCRLAGFKDLAQLEKSLRPSEKGKLYRIAVCFYAADPRIALREQTQLTTADLNTLNQKLERLDHYSKQGNWTREILLAIQAHPKLAAIELARLTGKEKDWLKLNIRKLKNLGLTISHHPGYELSPLGKMFLLQNETAINNEV